MMKQISYNLLTDKLSNNSAFYYKIIQDNIVFYDFMHL